ncbi:MAG: hypothetical protein PWQ79_1607 [Thermococcaceae archaeon]|nr:hypothetical protein [Thermococcaceae archaeon]
MVPHPLREAIEVKGSTEFTRAELVGILSFRLRLFSPAEAKARIEEWIKEGLLVEEEGKLFVTGDVESKKTPEDVFEEIIAHIARSLGWEREEVLAEISKLKERYGDLDPRLLAYLLGMEKGVDMSGFREKIEL